jgi:2,3-bisphosphoglycerate-independent phosphoglycerate mutase
VVLVSLDGWGLAPPSTGNAISQAKTPTMDYLYNNYPHGELIASGESVGLPATEVGNSEVGHLTMGVGRVIYQSLKRINISIENGSFYENEAFDEAVKHVHQNKSKLHLIGLIGSGNVHSSTEHLYALMQFCKKNMLSDVCLHLFTDGRDAPPKEGLEIISQIDAKLKAMGIGDIASVSGRYYSMDRDGRWERIELAYNAIVMGTGRQSTSATSAIEESYQAGKTDEFVEPTVILKEGKPLTVVDGDAVVFFNFRVDRARELTMAFVLPDFEATDMSKYSFSGTPFKRQKTARNMFFVTMTQYLAGLPVSAVAFPPQFNFPDSLPEIFSKHNIKSLHLAESEKERMVTYYFRGMNSTPFPLEDVVIVPSPKVATYDQKPEMSAWQVLAELKHALDKNTYKFVVVNFANPDMVAHSGRIEPTVKAIELTDKIVKELTDFVIERNGLILITSDHGNAEELLSYPGQSFYYTTEEGEKNTDHSSNPVPLIIVAKNLNGRGDIRFKGSLADIAPTILAIMKLETPKTMLGHNLLGEIHV